MAVIMSTANATSTTSEEDKERALKIYEKQFVHSTIDDKSADFPIFDYAELTLGPELGKGGFGVVSEIRSFDVSSMTLTTTSLRGVGVGVNSDGEGEKLNVELTKEGGGESTRSTSTSNQNNNPSTRSTVTLNEDEMQGRQFISDHCIRDGTDARYAIKILKKDLTGEKLIKGLADMAVETHILSAIEHPNIVKLRATAAQGRYDPYYFIVMDRLYDTLEKRIGIWAETNKLIQPPKLPSPKQEQSLTSAASSSPKNKKKGGGGGFFGLCGSKADKSVVVMESSPQPSKDQEDMEGETDNPLETPTEVKERKEKQNKLLEERLVAAFDLAAAIQYLHDRNIIYRDIKPENCAFDVRGDIKLFDFGTSKELPPQNLQKDLTFKLTGVTGSLPFMAPEVAKTEPYNHKCDTFSFSVMLWQIMALEMPFKEYESDLHLFFDEVHCGPHKRPPIPSTWPLPIQISLKRGWCQNPKERMEMEQLVKVLKKEIVRVRKGDATGLQHNRRRSTFVFRR